MSNDLSGAIKHALDIADKQDQLAAFCVGGARDDCLKRAGEYRQLAAWLEELEQRRRQPEIIHCSECAFPYIRGKNMYCDHITGEEIMVWKDEYCSWAERRTDETD